MAKKSKKIDPKLVVKGNFIAARLGGGLKARKKRK
jgi:hypothetical protein